MANFIGLVYATLKNEGVDTKGMSTDEAVKKYNELQKKSGGKAGEKEGTPAENKKMNGESPKTETKKEIKGTPAEEKRIKELGIDESENWEDGVLTGDSARFNKFLNMAQADKPTGDLIDELHKVGLNQKGIDEVWNIDELYENPQKAGSKLMSIFNKAEYRTDPKIQKQVNSWSDEMKYRMLSRMESDVKYYLGPAGRSNKALWAGNPEEHLEYMEEIYSQLKEKPEWLSEKTLREYRKQVVDNH